ncbi:GNAT family N-acetyltransferase [Microbacterium sp. CJ88]|uniref:GNAT family N-acetyltransferase n=1 Tax=Microbacterium sp. CJ88 TaxID=3445672 RepID=UPI003F65C695
MSTDAADVTIAPWGVGDLPLLEAANTPEMTRYLGGPESREKLLVRHARYLRLNETGEARMFRIEVDGEAAGGIGFWQIDHDGEPAWETGWNVLPDFQGRGVALRALRLCIADVTTRAGGGRNVLYAFPKPENAASDALCARAGFAFRGQAPFEYPKGVPITVNVWRLALR